MSFTTDFTDEDLKIFLEEAEEQLQFLEEGLLRLEQGAREPELIQSIFRAAHTLKGSSATLGFQQMASVTHALENIFDRVRKNQLSVDSAMVNVLLEALDILRGLKEELAGGKVGTLDLQGIHSRLEEIAGRATAPGGDHGESGSRREEKPAPPPEEPRATRVELTLAHDCPMPAVRAYQALMALEEMGNIIRSIPSAAEIENEKVGSNLVVELYTRHSATELQQQLQQIPDIAAILVESEGQGDREDREESMDASRPARRIQGTRSVRVDVELLDNVMNLVGELVIDRSRLAQIVSKLSGGREAEENTQELSRTALHIGRVTAQLQEEIMKARMIPIENLFKKFPRMMRDLAQQAGKELEFVVEGQDTELDRGVIDEIGDPLIHLLRNALDHGIEPPGERIRLNKPRAGRIRLAAQHEENQIVITVSDDGRGIDLERVRTLAISKGLVTEEVARRLSQREIIDFIFAPGFSTAERVTEVSGRGVGMDVVRKNLEKVNGSLEVATEPGRGTEFRIKLPLTLAIIRGLLVRLGEETYVIPLASVVEAILLPPGDVHRVNGHDAVLLRGKVLPLLRLEELFGLSRGKVLHPQKVCVVVVRASGLQLGITVDGLVGEQEVVVKSLGKFLGNIHGISGATILGEGDLALILDVHSLVKNYMASINGEEGEGHAASYRSTA